jgi:hypothetical protein
MTIVSRDGQVCCREVLGGIVHDYYRAAAQTEPGRDEVSRPNEGEPRLTPGSSPLPAGATAPPPGRC